MYYARPTAHEVYKRIREAMEALSGQQGFFANPGKAVGELYELGIEDTRELWSLILELLKEIDSKDYAGCKPPQKSYEEAIENQELFAFSWLSEKLGMKMYIKFALKKGRYYHVSLHPCRLTLPKENKK
jgi:hypothetical protein